jgi:hypothetical protein
MNGVANDHYFLAIGLGVCDMNGINSASDSM